MRFLLACLCALALATDALAQEGRWLRAESPAFVVYGALSEHRLRDAVEQLEAYDALLRRLTEAPAERSPTRLEVYLFGNPGQFREVWPRSSGRANGYYSARPDIIAAYAIFRGSGAQELLFHEYAHHFMYQHFANTYPAWYVEGFAGFAASTVFERDRVVLGRPPRYAAALLSAGSWLPMHTLISSAPHELDGDELAKFYAQSWLFAHYLSSAPERMAQFRVYARELRHGAAPAAALHTGFGLAPEDMQSVLRSYLERSPRAVAAARPSDDAAASLLLSRLPPSADRLLPLALRLRRGGAQGRDSSELLEEVRRAVGQSPTDRFALIALARAEATLGDPERARALLEPHVHANAQDVDALYLLGLAHLREATDATGDRPQTARAAQMGEARRYFVRAHRLDENHVPTLYRYAETFNASRLDEEEASNRINILLLAHQLAPQVPEITFAAAYALMARDRHDEAIPLLRMLVHDPHGGEGWAEGRALLTQAEARLRALGER